MAQACSRFDLSKYCTYMYLRLLAEVAATGATGTGGRLALLRYLCCLKGSKPKHGHIDAFIQGESLRKLPKYPVAGSYCRY